MHTVPCTVDHHRQQKAARLHALRDELATLDQDIANVQRRHGSKGTLSRSPSMGALPALALPSPQPAGQAVSSHTQLATAFASAAMGRATRHVVCFRTVAMPSVLVHMVFHCPPHPSPPLPTVPMGSSAPANGSRLALSRPHSEELREAEAALLRIAPPPSDANALAPADAPDSDAHARKAKRQRIATQFEDLHQCYLELRARAGRASSGTLGSGSHDEAAQRQGAHGQVVQSVEAAQGALLEGEGLVEFSRMLSVFASCGTLKVRHALRVATSCLLHGC